MRALKRVVVLAKVGISIHESAPSRDPSARSQPQEVPACAGRTSP